MKVVAFNSSPRPKGNTAILLSRVLDELGKEGIETEVVSLAGKRITGCIACYKCLERADGHCVITDDIVNDCLDRMVGADGILLGSPTYFGDVNASMKALIERTGMVARVNGGLLKRKVGAGVVAVRRAGAMHAFTSLNLFFLIAQMFVVGSSYWNIGFGREPGAVEKDEEGISTMQTLGQQMAWLLSKIHG
ncbi:MAG: flavodoxin family protein [Deltaproteobacteria bacterium]|nr:flavodoxin family protein [Deltaproteobacteria bacterium]